MSRRRQIDQHHTMWPVRCPQSSASCISASCFDHPKRDGKSRDAFDEDWNALPEARDRGRPILRGITAH